MRTPLVVSTSDDVMLNGAIRVVEQRSYRRVEAVEVTKGKGLRR